MCRSCMFMIAVRVQQRRANSVRPELATTKSDNLDAGKERVGNE